MTDSFLTIDGTVLLNDDFLLVVILAELCRGTSFMFAEQAVEMLANLRWLFIDFPEIDLAALGFPKGWEFEPLWK